MAEITNRTQEIAGKSSSFMPTEMMPVAMTRAKYPGVSPFRPWCARPLSPGLAEDVLLLEPPPGQGEEHRRVEEDQSRAAHHVVPDDALSQRVQPRVLEMGGQEASVGVEGGD